MLKIHLSPREHDRILGIIEDEVLTRHPPDLGAVPTNGEHRAGITLRVNRREDGWLVVENDGNTNGLGFDAPDPMPLILHITKVRFHNPNVDRMPHLECSK